MNEEVLAVMIERHRERSLDADAQREFARSLQADPALCATVAAELRLANAIAARMHHPDGATVWLRTATLIDLDRSSQQLAVVKRVMKRLPARNTRRWWWTAVAALIILSALLPLFASRGDQAVLTVAQVQGRVQIAGVQATVGQQLAPDDQLSGGTGSLIVLVDHDGTRLSLRDGDMRFQRRDGLLLHLDMGALDLEVATQMVGSHLRVRTPHCQAEVLGTRFSLRCSARDSRVMVQGGRVQISAATGPAVVLEAGGQAVASADAAITTASARGLIWNDRRPLVSWTLSNEPTVPSNPNGWFEDREADYTSPAGQIAFQSRLLAEADALIASCRRADAQGVVLMNIEGDGHPEIKYVGDPRLLATLAPEMDAAADQLFARLADAGLRTGVRLVHHRSERGADGRWSKRTNDADALTEIESRIAYVRQRWGCSVIFLSHNLTTAGNARYRRGEMLTEADYLDLSLLTTLADRHPDMLIIPEYMPDAAWTSLAGLRTLAQSQIPVQAQTLAPDAIAVLLIDAPGSADGHSVLSAARTAGSIPLIDQRWLFDWLPSAP